MRYKIGLFDLDGTLTDSKDGIIDSARRTLAYYGINPEPEDMIKFIGPPLRENFMSLYGFDAAKAEEATAKYREYYSTDGIFNNSVYPGIIEMLEKLQNFGVELMLATSKTTVYAERILEHFRMAGYFSFVAGAEFDGRRSHKKELIEYALENAKTRGDSKNGAVMVGDRKHDIIGAREAGIKSIGVTYGYGPREELISAGADHIADTPGETAGIILK